MTSTHRLIAIVVVWLVSAGIAFVTAGIAITTFMPSTTVTLLYATYAIAAAAATAFIVRAKDPGR